MEKKFSNLPLRKGVGVVLLNSENKVFVAKRIDNPKNFWQMPQGGVDENEDYLNAAFRELKNIKNKSIFAAKYVAGSLVSKIILRTQEMPKIETKGKD